MAFLHRFFLFPASPDSPKKELYITTAGIDLFTYHKQGAGEGTSFHLSAGKANEYMTADVLPEICNNGAFNGQFFKCTGEAVKGEMGMIKFTAWLNPQNITHVCQSMPNSTIVYFRSGRLVSIANNLPDFMRGLIEHNKKYSERKYADYGNRKERT